MGKLIAALSLACVLFFWSVLAWIRVQGVRAWWKGREPVPFDPFWEEREGGTLHGLAARRREKLEK